MAKPEIASYEQHDTRVTVKYKDGSSLTISPHSSNGNIGEFGSSKLYRKNSLVAMAVNYGGPDNRFWSPKGITQQEMAEYWNAAVDEANKLKQSYDAGEFGTQTWMDYDRDFWDITTQGGFVRRLLQEGQLQAFRNPPSTNHHQQ